MTSPMERSLERLRGLGWFPWIVEYRHRFTGKTMDLLGIIDVLALADKITLGIQVCGADFSEHLRKIMDEGHDNAVRWIRAGNRLEVWGWSPPPEGARGWRLRVVEFVCDGEGLGYVNDRWVDLEDERASKKLKQKRGGSLTRRGAGGMMHQP